MLRNFSSVIFNRKPCSALSPLPPGFQSSIFNLRWIPGLQLALLLLTPILAFPQQNSLRFEQNRTRAGPLPVIRKHHNSGCKGIYVVRYSGWT